jgi:hypothetical protein
MAVVKLLLGAGVLAAVEGARPSSDPPFIFLRCHRVGSLNRQYVLVVSTTYSLLSAKNDF